MATEKKRCGAPTKTGTPCQLFAGTGTTHPGFGQCHYHGGATPDGRQQAAAEAAQSVTFDMLDGIEDVDFREMVRRQGMRADIVDLVEDLNLMRGVVMRYVNESAEHENALLRWSASWDRDWQTLTLSLIEELQIAQLEEDWERYADLLQKVPDPMRFMDRPRKVPEYVTVIAAGMDRVAKLSQILYDRISDGSVPARDVEYLMGRIADEISGTLRAHVPDITHRAAIQAELERRFAALRIPSWEEPGDEAAGDYGAN